MQDIRRFRDRLVATIGAYLRASVDTTGGRLIVDLSTIAQNDARTGIQRVVRALWWLLHDTPLEGYSVVPVVATAKRGYCVAPISDGEVRMPAPDAPLVEIGAGDIFLGLDLAAHRLWRHRRQMARWKRRGATVAITVYDLLPLREPDWFPSSTARNFGRWIRIVMRYADLALCISQQVVADMRSLMEVQGTGYRRLPQLVHLPLSGDISGSRPSGGIDDAGRAIIAKMEQRPTILMVGTIEPRKAHTVLLMAYDHWRDTAGDEAPDLVIVGRRGWRTEALQQRMLEHPARGDRFVWLDDASDELLAALYVRAALVVVPSYGEGFGLPVVEALGFGCRVLARDLPVFRELDREGLSYFESDAPVALVQAMSAALQQPPPVPASMSEDWTVSLSVILHALAIKVKTAASNETPGA
ncbi:glycosyltransferase family 4 protein [Sphingobium scionense]|uniref:Glycosyltransferase involved in cell wall biosynthesis n=1 Tax=Sphingobium scionense TaxID=1404341 RepID=A0A7W6LQN2_9SPHN|nr:glycosyltransferase family 1 protein [Sphingobium scionense]MBB4148581.1 glycosyltransferase involved in cell wall biosynthesis [Sphingobium scionense]